MKIKRWLGILIFTSIFAIVLSSLASAQFGGIDLRSGSEQIINWIVEIFEPFLQVLLGGQDYTGLLLFERLLVFVLVLSIVYVAMKNISVFDDYPYIVIIISLIASLISVRYMDYVWLNTVLISYQILGIVLAGVLPLIIYIFFINNISESPIFRKIGWIFFIVVYFGLWITNETDNYAQIYFWTMLIAFVFFLLDGTIHNYLENQKWREAGKTGIDLEIAHKDKNRRDIESSTSIPPKTKKHQIDKIEKEIRELKARRAKL